MKFDFYFLNLVMKNSPTQTITRETKQFLPRHELSISFILVYLDCSKEFAAQDYIKFDFKLS